MLQDGQSWAKTRISYDSEGKSSGRSKGYIGPMCGGMTRIPCYCKGWDVFKTHDELESTIAEYAACQHIREKEGEQACKRFCELFFEGVQPDPEDLPQILEDLQRNVLPGEQKPRITNGYGKVVVSTETLRASAATTYDTHPMEIVRVWKLIAEKTKLDQADANISAIACEIFGRSRGRMAEEALKAIQSFLLDEGTMYDAQHAIGLCTVLAGAPVIDAEVDLWVSATQKRGRYSGPLSRTFDEPEPMPIWTGASVQNCMAPSVSALPETRRSTQSTTMPTEMAKTPHQQVLRMMGL